MLKINKLFLLALISGGISLSIISNVQAGSNSKEGKKIYEQNCSSCHGVKGKGDSPIAASLNPKPRDFVTAKFKYGSTDKDLFKTISNGKGIMPPWKGTLSEKQIYDVIAYIRSFKGKK